MPDLDAPIDVLQVSVRSYNALKRAGYGTVRQVLEAPNDDLIGLLNVGGLRALREVRGRIALYLAGENPGAWLPD